MEGGASQVLPLQKGEGVYNVLAMPRGDTPSFDVSLT